MFSGELTTTNTPVVLVQSLPAVSRLPAGQTLLQPCKTKTELIFSGSEEDDVKIIVSRLGQEKITLAAWVNTNIMALN